MTQASDQGSVCGGPKAAMAIQGEEIMNQHDVEIRVEELVETIDAHMLRGEIPKDAMTFEEVCKHAAMPVGNLRGLTDLDRERVIGRVDEVLRIRAGGVY